MRFCLIFYVVELVHGVVTFYNYYFSRKMQIVCVPIKPVIAESQFYFYKQLYALNMTTSKILYVLHG